MSAQNHAAILTREELAALLDGAGEPEVVRPIGMTDPGPARAELTRVAERFGEEIARGLSTLHQTPIGFRFSHWEEIGLRDFASAMLPTDRVACLDVGRGDADVYLLLSRPLVFGWMMISFGAKPGAGNELVPARAYTRIEERFLTRSATEVAQSFAKALGAESKDGRVVSLAPPVALYERSKRPYLVASFEVSGFGELCGIRLAVPSALLEDRIGDAPAVPVEATGRVADQLLDTPVELHVQIGFTDVPLSEMASMKPGDEIGLTRAGKSGLLVHIEDFAKYQAELGNMGGKLAVRITEVLTS